jgi:hypothetical protein
MRPPDKSSSHYKDKANSDKLPVVAMGGEILYRTSFALLQEETTEWLTNPENRPDQAGFLPQKKEGRRLETKTHCWMNTELEDSQKAR